MTTMKKAILSTRLFGGLMHTIIRRVCLFSLAAMLGCSKSFDRIAELQNYVRSDDYSMHQSVSKNGVRMDMTYWPTDMVMAGEYAEAEAALDSPSANTDSLKASLGERRKQFAQSLYFRFVLSYEDQRDVEYVRLSQGYKAYGDWLRTLLFGLQEKISLQVDEDTEVPMDIYHMERDFGVAKSTTFLLLFPSTFNSKDLRKETHSLAVVLDEFGMATGRIRFDFDVPFDEPLYSNPVLAQDR